MECTASLWARTANNDTLSIREQGLSTAKWMLLDVERLECVGCHVIDDSYLRWGVVASLNVSAATVSVDK